MQNTYTPEKLARLTFWSAIGMGAFFSMFLLQGGQGVASTVHFAAQAPTAPSLYTLPYLEVEHERAEDSALLEFFQTLTTEEGESPVVAAPSQSALPEICDNNIDEDKDGHLDHEDSDCASTFFPSQEDLLPTTIEEDVPIQEPEFIETSALDDALFDESSEEFIDDSGVVDEGEVPADLPADESTPEEQHQSWWQAMMNFLGFGQ